MKQPIILLLAMCLLVAGGQTVLAEEGSPSTGSESGGGAETNPAAGGAETPKVETVPEKAEKPPEPAAPPDKNAMYGEQFKCSDGYNPDTDASLHPPNQDSKVRMIINAQAQQAHQQKIEQQASAASKPADEEGKKLEGTPSQDKKAEAEPKDGKKKDDKKDGETAKEDEKDGKKEAKKEDSNKAPVKAAYEPLKEALYLIQTQKYQDSEAVLLKFLSKNTKSIDGHYLLAVAFVGQRKYREAADQYKEVIALGPNTRQATLSQEGLKKISF